jgi:hypothetical protein
MFRGLEKRDADTVNGTDCDVCVSVDDIGVNIDGNDVVVADV